MKGRELEQALAAQLVDEWRHLIASQTEHLEALAGQTVNHVLAVWSGQFDATAVIGRDFAIAAGSVVVANYSAANQVVVSSAGPQANIPTGTGTWIVPAGKVATVPLASHQLSIYGTDGDSVAFQVYTLAPRPVAG